MEDTITRVDEQEVASFLDRIALFSAGGCKPQEALRYSWSSMRDDTTLHREMRSAIAAARDVKSSAELLLEVGQRVDSEGLALASMAFTAHVVSGVDLGHALANLAEVIRRQCGMPSGKRAEFEKELAVASLADKLGYLAEIGKSSREDALALLAKYDRVLGPELLQTCRDLRGGCPLPEALARCGERTGNREITLLAEPMEVSASTGFARDTILHQAAEVIRRNLGA